MLRSALALALLVCATASAYCPTSKCTTRLKVTIKSLAPANGTFQTPFWVGFHDGTFDTYNTGDSLDEFPGMEALVEDGNNAPLMEAFAVDQPYGTDGNVGMAPIGPGDVVEAFFDVDPSANMYFSYASMILPSNDAFVSNADPRAFRVFKKNGRFRSVDFVVPGTQARDGGTELNTEDEESTAFLGQSMPNTGEPEEEGNDVVSVHPGFLEDGRVLAAFPNGDFTVDDYEFVQITVSRVGDSCGRRRNCRVVNKRHCNSFAKCKKGRKYRLKYKRSSRRTRF